MSFPKIFAIAAILIFGFIGIAAWMKSGGKEPSKTIVAVNTPIEVELEQTITTTSTTPPDTTDVAATIVEKQEEPVQRSDEDLPEDDRIEELFNLIEPKSSIVETIIYKSRVPWQKGRPAWLSDYASHYATSRHFIARSLNGKAEYFKQDVAEGDRFNVLKPNKNLHFYLVIDTSRSKMWFYYHDLDTNERSLLKTYKVGLGRVDSSKSSGLLTPLGKYSLGSKIAIYKPKMTGFYNGEKIEMLRVFGTRWIPFDKEISDATAPASGYGIHGVPWIPDNKGGLAEDIESLGKYESDGCIRLATNDIEELFAIIITRPTYIELVKDFHLAKLPGVEKKNP